MSDPAVAPFYYDEWGEWGQADIAHTFIQWKGTDVCLDFICICGAQGHFDGYFAYVLECSKCGGKWEMPFILYPRLCQDQNTITQLIDMDETC